MFTVDITLKSFESYYIEKNAAFLKNLLLLSKSNTVNIKEIDVKEILGLLLPLKKQRQTSQKSHLTLGEKHTIQNDTTNKHEVIDFVGHRPEYLYKSVLKETGKTDVNTQEPTVSEIPYKKRSYIVAKKDFSEINLPIKRKLFTVLRSVHVHKKSRLQFYFTHYIKKLTFQAANVKIMFLILYIVKNAEFYGVELEISLNHKTV